VLAFKVQVMAQKFKNQVLKVLSPPDDNAPGFSLRPKTEHLLSSFETATGFMKRMNAIESWGIVGQRDPLELGNHTSGPPKIEPLDNSKVANEDTGLLRGLWYQQNICCMTDPAVREAATNAPPKCKLQALLGPLE